ncbi:HYR domain-containing protein [Thermodesulfobacteriota bacterium]
MSDTDEVVITVEDRTAPEPDVVPLPAVTGQCSATISSAPIATDNCAGTVIGTTTDPLTYTDQGTYTVTWTYDDGNENVSTQTQTVIVDDTEAPLIVAPSDVTEEQTNRDGTSVDLGLPQVNDNCDASPVVTNNAPVVFPLGETIVTWTATDYAGNQATAPQLVTIVDTTQPELSIAPSVTTLWPVNHKYVTVSVSITASDICDADVGSKVQLVSVTSDEPEDIIGRGNKKDGGDGNTMQDIVIVDNTTVKLRAERAAGADGRVYTLNYSVTDASGNTTTASATVTVVHNPGEPAVDSGVQYVVTP